MGRPRLHTISTAYSLKQEHIYIHIHNPTTHEVPLARISHNNVPRNYCDTDWATISSTEGTVTPWLDPLDPLDPLCLLEHAPGDGLVVLEPRPLQPLVVAPHCVGVHVFTYNYMKILLLLIFQSPREVYSPVQLLTAFWGAVGSPNTTFVAPCCSYDLLGVTIFR